jgi:Ca2+-transporting ATPase
MNDLWYSKTYTEVFEALDSGEHGLKKAEVSRRLGIHGKNKLPQGKVESIWIIFLRQFRSPLIYILLAASFIVFAMGEMTDGGIILAVLFFNAVVGTVQEDRARNMLLALEKFVETKATVVRESQEIIVSDSDLVPGDILILQEGERVPADARVFVSHNLTINEAALTGESEPVHKITDAIPKDVSLVAEQKNMVFKGTYVTSGNGRAIVTATGVNTVIGKIAQEISLIDTEIPLKANIRYLSRLIIIVVAAVGMVIFTLGILLGNSFATMFTTVVSLSVSIIPEGLPIVMTLVLATGVWRMSKRNVLVKRLQAVEALGQSHIIAVDKTGTITRNELAVAQVYAGGVLFEISGSGYEPKGSITVGGTVVDPSRYPKLMFAAKMAAFCANARAIFSEESDSWRVSGDPTEAAMFIFAQKLGFYKDDLERSSPLVAEIPFDYRSKYHATLHRADGSDLLVVAGAPESVIEISGTLWKNGDPDPLSINDRIAIESSVVRMSQNGLRVLALAVRESMPGTLSSQAIHNLAFVALLGMKDTLRPEVKESMRRATSAGVRVVMITGDHKVTAMAIAKEAGIYHTGDEVLTGSDIEKLFDAELDAKIPRVSVFARVTPEHKLQIINAYKRIDEIVAMTGDGVNDAPSLVAADLGVAMGKGGTEVAKEAADIVLLDDDFGSIVSAIEEGRSIYTTIKKVILYLFSTSTGEVFTIAAALLLGYPLPLMAAQIIWLNFVTDGFLDVALAMEPKEQGLLLGRFERPKKYLVDRLMVKRMFLMALPMMIGTLILFRSYAEADIVKAWTISLTVLAAFQWLNAWNCRSEDRSIFEVNPFSNKFLLGATGIVITLQFLAVYHPFMQGLLHTAPLAPADWFIIIPIALSIVLVEEVRKLLARLGFVFFKS